MCSLYFLWNVIHEGKATTVTKQMTAGIFNMLKINKKNSNTANGKESQKQAMWHLHDTL